MSAHESHRNHRVLIIGIDGGTFDVIRPLVDRGELPVLASLMRNGMWGDLESTIPPDTGPAWVSMMTGVNPGKHGVFFFLGGLHDNLRYGRSLGSPDIKFPPLWSVLSRNGRRVLFLNVPFTYPPEAVNGVMVSGMLVPDSAQVVSHPPEVYDELQALCDGFPINDWSPDVICSDTSKFHRYFDKTVRLLATITEKRTQAALHLLKKEPWDLGMVVFTSIDRLQHLFWEYQDRPDTGGLATAVHDGYRQIDRSIGEILAAAGRDVTVIVASDHGFGPLRKYFYVNKWLEEIGLLSVKKGSDRKKLRFSQTTLKRVLERLAPAVQAPGWTERIPVPRPWFAEMSTSERIDWSRTKAYGDPSGGINVNLAGREPEGIVQGGREFEEVLQFIEERFREIRDGSDDRCIADWIRRKEDLYQGPFLHEAADLYYSLSERSYLHNTNIDGNGRTGACTLGTGMHRRNGICIISGPQCRNNVPIEPKITDIAPTALYFLGEPILEAMDGRVLEEGILPERLAAQPVSRIADAGTGVKEASFSNDDEARIQESLKGLGYL